MKSCRWLFSLDLDHYPRDSYRLGLTPRGNNLPWCLEAARLTPKSPNPLGRDPIIKVPRTPCRPVKHRWGPGRFFPLITGNFCKNLLQLPIPLKIRNNLTMYLDPKCAKQTLRIALPKIHFIYYVIQGIKKRKDTLFSVITYFSTVELKDIV